MSILFSCQNDADKQIENRLRQSLPNEVIYTHPDLSAIDKIDFAVIWQPPINFFDGLHNLQAIFSIAAGVDHVLEHPGLPENVPIVRLLDAGMGEKMAEYVLYGVLHAQRRFAIYQQAQREKTWAHDAGTVHARDFHVGILGLGTLGRCVAERLHLNGYHVSGWSKSYKSISNIMSFTGEDGLRTMLATTNVLVCLLPLTNNTRHFLNQRLFSMAPPGLFVINLARGAHLVDHDLIDALNSGQLSGALLDVTDPEPLPPTHSFWTDNRIILTPHIAGPTQEQESVQQIVDNIKRFRRGEPLSGVVNTQNGY